MNPILARFQDQPSLIAPSGQAWFESCVQEAAKVAENGGLDPASILAGEDFWFAADDPRARYRPYNVSAGILRIPVKGALLNDFPYSLGSYATGYEYVAAAMARGLADTEVNGHRAGHRLARRHGRGQLRSGRPDIRGARRQADPGLCRRDRLFRRLLHRERGRRHHGLPHGRRRVHRRRDGPRGPFAGAR